VKNDLMIEGQSVARTTFKARSHFYETYSWEVSNATTLDLAKVVGAANRAPRPTLAERVGILERAAGLFACSEEHVEHAVRTTGMPISVIRAYIQEIPKFLLQVSAMHRARAGSVVHDLPAQHLAPGVDLARDAEDGFCYVVTPGNDPRVSAVVAANLVFTGMPFVIKASREDAFPPLLLRALHDAGLPSTFGSVVYFDIDSPDAQTKHFKLVDAAAFVWVFGADDTVDRILRLENKEPRVMIDLSPYVEAGSESTDLPPAVRNKLESGGLRIDREPVVFDHFAGKTVLRHGSGNCATIVKGNLSQDMAATLYGSIRYAIGCNSTKSGIVVDGPGWIEEAKRYFASLVVGDPLREDTQIGFVEPNRLVALDALIARNRSHVVLHGGEAVSACQRRPLIIEVREPAPELLSTEISVYSLAVARAASIDEAVTTLNEAMKGVPRLAVSLLGLSAEEATIAASRIRSHAVTIDAPSSTIVPTCHEGNDYLMRLTRPKMIVRKTQPAGR
jgi:acyl-CoA reductase-like NAD-dependent aldehyde dehydrogenase